MPFLTRTRRSRLTLAALGTIVLLHRDAAGQTYAMDRLRLNAGPCQITSADGSPDKIVLSQCPVLTTSPSTNLTLNPTGDLVLAPTGTDILPDVGYTHNLGAISNKYLTLHAAELWVETLVAQNTIATIGGRVLVAPTTTLTADLAPASTTISVKHNSLANGDRVYLEADGKVEWLAVSSSASGSGPYTYTVTRNLDGSGANQWYAGDAVLNTGTTGKGFIDLYSLSGVLSGSGPTVVGNVRTGTTYNQIAPRWAVGNLNGLYGYGAETYGFAAGDSAATNVTIDATNGLRIRSGTTNKLQADTSGNLSLTGDLSLGSASVFRSSTATGLTTGDGFYLTGGSTPTFRIGNPAGNRLIYDSSTGILSLFGNGNGLTSIGPGSLTVGMGRNLIRNSDCVVGTHGWTAFTNAGGHTILQGSNSSTARLNTGPNTCWFGITTAPANGTASLHFVTEMTPVVAGNRYEGSAYLVGINTGNSLARIQWLNIDGTTEIGVSDGNTCAAGATPADELTEFCRSGVVATAPTNTKNARLIVITTHNGATNPVVFHVHNYLGEAYSGQTELTPWGPAGITSIVGGMIEADTITATNIAAATITGSKIAAGTITGTNIAATTITASNIAAATIDATKLNVSTLSAITANLGTVTAGTIDGATINAGTSDEVVLNSSGITITDYTASANSRIKWTGGAFVVGYSGPVGLTLSASGIIILDTGSVQLGNATATVQVRPFLGGGANQTVCADNSGVLYTVASGAAC